jgi:transcriptional regulator with XRE-family HTH domain
MSITELNGTSIRVGRAVKGWSQRELAQACGFTIYKIWSFENRVRRPKPEEWAKIWGALTSE